MPAKDGRPNKTSTPSIISILTSSWLNWLLIFVPISLAIDLLGFPKIWLFVTSALAIVPIAGLIGAATEQLAHRVGPGIGGLLNATFGNATELIIAFFALQAGLPNVVKASISGSIIGNILLVFGLAVFVGGLGRDKQTFNRTNAGAAAAMLFLASVALVMPALFDLTVFGSLERSSPILEQLSLLVAFVLLATYVANLIFSLKTHKDLFISVPEEERNLLEVKSAVVLLLGATILAALEAELLGAGLTDATAALGMTELFVGVVVVAVVGNAAEHFSAVSVAKKNQTDLAVTIATGSATQIALFVAPVLVIASFLMGQPLSLVFNAFEVVGITLAVLILAFVSLDGETNWFEGAQLIAVYVILAIVFYFVPA
jgi:Ca2+:H+ antiporter